MQVNFQCGEYDVEGNVKNYKFDLWILWGIISGKVGIKNIEYNNEKCVKVVSDEDYIIARKDDYRIVNDDGTDIELEIGTVTDEDIAMPNIDEYEKY